MCDCGLTDQSKDIFDAVPVRVGIAVGHRIHDRQNGISRDRKALRAVSSTPLLVEMRPQRASVLLLYAANSGGLSDSVRTQRFWQFRYTGSSVSRSRNDRPFFGRSAPTARG
jgi:hypothetical protein